jgi:glycerophosphoryl diester phosphodiesterase
MNDLSWLLGRPVAHRGLHSAGIPENSLAACREAIRHGYTVELDVRRTRDDVLVVFHDANLLRMTGQDRFVADCTFADLEGASLSGTDERIPALQTFLGTAGGRTGLLIEVKPHGTPGMTEVMLARMLDGYEGPFAIASFDPFVLRWFRKNRPAWTRVQITGRLERHAVGRIRRFLVKNHIVLLISRPDALACEVSNLGLWTRFIAWLFCVPLIAWTVRDPATARALEGSVATIIFEGFRYRKS